jgi:epoxyqueuosine reductase
VPYIREHYGINIYACGLCQTGVPCEKGIPSELNMEKSKK